MKRLLKQGVVLAAFILLSVSVFPRIVLAVPYGEGSYGEGKYNEGETPATTAPSSSNSLTPAGAPQCNDTAPGSAPWLYSAIAQNGNSIMLYFTDATDPVDKYALEFGTSSGDYQFGADNIGGKGARTYSVGSLQPNTTYYFRVRAGNGCATGAWSNEISAKTKGVVSFNQFQTTDIELEPSAQTEDESKPVSNACTTYTVKSGDSLWSIAASELGDGNLYQDIIGQNKEQYPSLATSNSVSAGWELKINCDETSQTDKAATEEAALDSYIVNVNVFGKSQEPIGGATVTIHSDPQEAITDENGKVRFESVEPGEHRVLVTYDGYEGEQSIFLTGDTKEFTLNITLEMKSMLTSPQVLAIIGGFSLVVIVLVVLLIRVKSKSAS